MDRADLALLGMAALLVSIVLLFFSFWEFSRELTRELCEDSDGVWNECGSLCTGEPPGAMCADVCVPVCECRSSFQCPPEYYCRTSGIVQNETGVCAPILGGLCKSEADCARPRCLGMYSVCQEGGCRVVNEMGALDRCQV